MSSVIYSVPNKVVHGPNSLEYLSELDGKKAVLVTGWSSMKRFGFLDNETLFRQWNASAF